MCMPVSELRAGPLPRHEVLLSVAPSAPASGLQAEHMLHPQNAGLSSRHSSGVEQQGKGCSEA